MILGTIVNLVTSTAVSTVVTNAIKATTPKDLSLVNKGLTIIGTFVLSGMAGDMASNYVIKGIEKRFPKSTEPAK